MGMNPRMNAIMGAFQILWVDYGLLIASRQGINMERDCGVDQEKEARAGGGNQATGT
jgi:hypothetical protein